MYGSLGSDIDYFVIYTGLFACIYMRRVVSCGIVTWQEEEDHPGS